MTALQVESTPMRQRRDYVCPQCRAPVREEEARYVCAGCDKDYPVLCGIPDFRLAPDRYLTLEQERAKATRLHDYAQDHSFAETIAEYYRVTDDVPPAMATRFADYVLTGETRGRALLDGFPSGGGKLLDVGCGAGGAVVAAARDGQSVSGLDIALRWLVIAQKQLAEEGLSAELVCADIAHAPFPDGTFERVLAADLFEHLPETPAGTLAISTLLAPGGHLHATGANRYTLAPYPPAGLWGIGYMPTTLRRRYVIWRRGLDTLRFLNMQSPGGLTRALRKAGLECVWIAPMNVPTERWLAFGAAKQFALSLYRRLCANALTGKVLLHIGPVFEITARSTSDMPSRKRTLP